MHEVLLSATFLRQFRKLGDETQERLRQALAVLADDPLTPRPKADIKRLAGTDPVKHRLRVGDWRIVYAVDGPTVRVLEVFARGRGYRLD
ncbi:MAG: mRNA interferase RelE/StbE [Thermoplasmata archaeon]|jgi:mRNA interferase RelE/StbE|nr:mRNA interferase RelE/StbE [Thermoplasmata archaeon]